MAKAKLDDQLAQLAALRADPNTPDARRLLTEALTGKSNLAAAKAADVVRDARLVDLVPHVVGAFDRFLAPVTDKGCVAKTSIARALDVLEQNEPDVFLRGVRHTQPEPVFGGSADAAAELRGICAAALARLNHRDALWEISPLLADEDAGARAAGARAIAHTGRDEGAALLRMKLRLGDEEPGVISECVLALLRLSPTKGITAAKQILDDSIEGDARGATLMALGESRLPAALQLLREHYDAEPNVAKRVEFLLPMAITRRAEAIEFLVTLVEEQRPATAVAAIAALGTFRHDSAIRGRVERIAKDRDDAEIRAATAKHFYD